MIRSVLVALTGLLFASEPASAGERAQIVSSPSRADVVIYFTWNPRAPKVYVGRCPGGGEGPLVRIAYTGSRYEATLSARVAENIWEADIVYCT